jgi:hypothetical protein
LLFDEIKGRSGMEKGVTNNPLGRPKGIPDRRTVKVQEKLEELGCDPIELLAFIAMADARLKEVPDLNQRLAAAKELASYIAPKLKAIEHTGDVGSTVVDMLMNLKNDRS